MFKKVLRYYLDQRKNLTFYCEKCLSLLLRATFFEEGAQNRESTYGLAQLILAKFPFKLMCFHVRLMV